MEVYSLQYLRPEADNQSMDMVVDSNWFILALHLLKPEVNSPTKIKEIV